MKRQCFHSFYVIITIHPPIQVAPLLLAPSFQAGEQEENFIKSFKNIYLPPFWLVIKNPNQLEMIVDPYEIRFIILFALLKVVTDFFDFQRSQPMKRLFVKADCFKTISLELGCLNKMFTFFSLATTLRLFKYRLFIYRSKYRQMLLRFLNYDRTINTKSLCQKKFLKGARSVQTAPSPRLLRVLFLIAQLQRGTLWCELRASLLKSGDGRLCVQFLATLLTV